PQGASDRRPLDHLAPRVGGQVGPPLAFICYPLTGACGPVCGFSSIEVSMSGTCLVTGGAGFIGSHLVEALSKQGRRVRVLDDLWTGAAPTLEGLSGVELVRGDVGDPAAVARAAEGAELVFHIAALASVQKSVEAPAESHRVCATGTLHVL